MCCARLAPCCFWLFKVVPIHTLPNRVVYAFLGFMFLVWLGCVPFFRYADLKVKMAMMEAEKDGEADLKDEWQ